MSHKWWVIEIFQIFLTMVISWSRVEESSDVSSEIVLSPKDQLDLIVVKNSDRTWTINSGRPTSGWTDKVCPFRPKLTCDRRVCSRFFRKWWSFVTFILIIWCLFHNSATHRRAWTRKNSCWWRLSKEIYLLSVTAVFLL